MRNWGCVAKGEVVALTFVSAGLRGEMAGVNNRLVP